MVDEQCRVDERKKKKCASSMRVESCSLVPRVGAERQMQYGSKIAVPGDCLIRPILN